MNKLSTSKISSYCNHNCVCIEDTQTIKPRKNRDGKNIEIILAFLKLCINFCFLPFMFKTDFKGGGEKHFIEKTSGNFFLRH